MRRHWFQRAVSDDGRAIATAINSVSIPDEILAKVHCSSTVNAASDCNSSTSSSHSSLQVEWSTP